jgi:hypothetical protein
LKQRALGEAIDMVNDNMKQLEARTVAAAEAALAARKFVTAIDVLQGIGWLPQARVDEWRQGRLDYLERGVSTNLHRISAVMKMFRRWAQSRGLAPRETAYVSRTRDRHQLRFSKSGAVAIEQAYRTHWISPDLSVGKQERLRERQARAPDLVVISPLSDWTCSKCGGTGDFLMMDDTGPLCRHCARAAVWLVCGAAGCRE